MHYKYFKIVPSSESGYNTIIVTLPDGKTGYLHSKIAPSKESEHYASVLSKSNADTLILIGIGLAHHLKRIHTCKNLKTIIAIDIIDHTDENKNLLIEKFSNYKGYFIFSKTPGDVHNELISLIDLSKMKSILVLEHIPSFRLFPEYYSKIKQDISSIISKKAGDIKTVNSFSNLYNRNCIKKMASLQNYTALSEFKIEDTSVPCIIISSAPSIDHYIKIIKDYSSYVFIICIDSAYPILKSAGIVPDVIISIDPQPWTREHLTELNNNIPVISTLSAYDTGSSSILYMNSHPFSQVLNHHNSKFPMLESKTGTVAGDALIIADYIGFKTIIVCGLDFSFPEHCIYSKDSAYNKRYTYHMNSRLNTTETLHQKYIQRSDSSLKINGIRTRNSFLQFKSSIENLIKSLNSSEVIHLHHSGLSLNYSRHIDTIQNAKIFFSSLNKMKSNKFTLPSITSGKLDFFYDTQLFGNIILDSGTFEDIDLTINRYYSLFLKLSGELT